MGTRSLEQIAARCPSENEWDATGEGRTSSFGARLAPVWPRSASRVSPARKRRTGATSVRAALRASSWIASLATEERHRCWPVVRSAQAGRDAGRHELHVLKQVARAIAQAFDAGIVLHYRRDPTAFAILAVRSGATSSYSCGSCPSSG